MKKTNVFTTIGARNYALEPKAVELLLDIERVEGE